MTRAAERERLGVIIELQFAASDAHGVEDSLMHLDDFLETLAHIVVIAVDPISDERPFQLQLVEIGRFRNAVFLDGQLLARAIERDLPDCVVAELLAQLITEETPILNEIEQRAGMPILRFLLSGNACATRGAGSVSRPAVVFDRRFEGGKLTPELCVSKILDLRGRLRSSKGVERFDSQAIRLLDRMVHQIASHGLARIGGVRAQEDHWVLDAVGGEHDDLSRYEAIAFVQRKSLALLVAPLPAPVVHAGDALAAFI